MTQIAGVNIRAKSSEKEFSDGQMGLQEGIEGI